MATTTTSTKSLRKWRISQFEGLGFSREEAVELESAKRTTFAKSTKGVSHSYEVPLDYHAVSRILDAGATQDQVLRIFV